MTDEQTENENLGSERRPGRPLGSTVLGPTHKSFVRLPEDHWFRLNKRARQISAADATGAITTASDLIREAVERYLRT